MAGQHLAELTQWVEGMNEEDVTTSEMAWSQVANALHSVSQALIDAAPGLKEGFGDSDIGSKAPAAFHQAAKTLEDQQKPLLDASDALGEVRLAMSKASKTHGNPVTVPGPAPQQENYPGIPLVADIQFAMDKAKHNADVAAYNKSDEEAAKRIAELNTSYAAAITVFTKIHGDPYIPVDPDDTTGGGNGPTGNRPTPGTGAKPVRPIGTVIGDDDTPGKDDHPDRPDPVDPPRPPIRDIDNGVDENWPTFDPDPIGGDPSPTGPGSGTISAPPGGGGGISPGLLGGGLAAGAALSAPGAIKGISGMLSRAGLSGGGTIGASSRAGGPGALGRSGAGTPGSPTARGGAGAGGRGAGGRAGAPGSQGGRGGRGGAGGRGGRGTGAGGGRGRGKKDAESGQDQEFYDDGQDWIDDEGAGPSVLG